MIELHGITKRYGEVDALRGVSFTVERGEALTLLGPNGSGKTTLLRIIAGLETNTMGEVFFDGVKVDGKNFPEVRRRITMVFQRTVILKGTVSSNVEYGLRVRGFKESEITQRVREALTTVGLEGLRDRRSSELSGGEQQRLSLARALALGCEVLLLDEPTANLDPESLSIVKDTIGMLRRRDDVTVVMATHNLEQAEELSDRIVLMDRGEVVEIGEPCSLFVEPSPEMARFTRSSNVFTGDSSMIDGVTHVDIGEGIVVRAAFSGEGRSTIHVRPGDIIVSSHLMESSARNNLKGRITRIEDLGRIVRLDVDVGRTFKVQITHKSLGEMGLNVGQEVYLTFKASSVQRL
ncbi:MAG: ABC transporter ATP-binding protein [Candidatus Bathyarchaeota archaeon]